MHGSIIARMHPLAREQGLRFLLIGGHAVIALGFVRATLDWDFLVPEAERERWKRLFANIGYSVYAETSAFAQLQPPPDLPIVDLMVVSDTTFDKLTSGSLRVDAEGCSLLIPSAQNMVALKLHAARQRTDPEKRDKDLTDVIEIIRRNSLSLDNAEFRELVLRYGGPDAIGFVQRRTRFETD